MMTRRLGCCRTLGTRTAVASLLAPAMASGSLTATLSKETFRRDLKSGGFGIVEMLFSCNILALVGGGSNVAYPVNKVMIWDDHRAVVLGVAFRADVRAVNWGRTTL
ncbi:hypothetical protein QYE76_016645 [Lolium multiflorum]|uniref:Uncharacterized protein n=1 Tax=Lolium multiflorum TaxID=4521 RepID=A0AAD8PI42_LOLMU|nr:hypothetical protein QYE76_016645 [Lolium multiflorum]